MAVGSVALDVLLLVSIEAASTSRREASSRSALPVDCAVGLLPVVSVYVSPIASLFSAFPALDECQYRGFAASMASTDGSAWESTAVEAAGNAAKWTELEVSGDVSRRKDDSS